MRPKAEIRLGRAGNFLFAQTVISRRPCFAFHTSAHDAAVLGEGVEIPFSLPKTFFSVRSRAVLLLFLELLSLVLYSHSFDIFCRSLRSFTQPILFRTLTHLHTAVVLALSHTPRALEHTPPTHKTIHPSIKKGASNPSHHHRPVNPKETPKPPKKTPKCPPSAPPPQQPTAPS